MKTILIKIFAPLLLLTPFAIYGCSPPDRQSQIGVPNRIAWFATLASGLAEAERSGRPILFTSAAPQCEGVSGMW